MKDNEKIPVSQYRNQYRPREAKIPLFKTVKRMLILQTKELK